MEKSSAMDSRKKPTTCLFLLGNNLTSGGFVILWDIREASLFKCHGGTAFSGDVKILTLSLIFGFLRSPCVHFIHQKLNSVEKNIFFCPP